MKIRDDTSLYIEESALREQIPDGNPDHLNSIYNEIAVELGTSAEDRVDTTLALAIERELFPSWLKPCWQRSEPNSPSDRAGVDFMLYTFDPVMLPLNIKSSRQAARTFEAEHVGEIIRAVVIDIRLSVEDTWRVLIHTLSLYRTDILSGLFNRARTPKPRR